MLKRYLLLALFSVFLMSCIRKVKFKPPPDEVADTSIINLSPVQLDTIDQSPVDFKGLYTYGNGVSTFRDCKTGKVYWLTDSSGKIAEMYSAINRYPGYSYESVYAEIKGYLNGNPTSGYDNELRVTSVLKAESKNFQTACYPYEFIALGNEPFWSVDIIPAEDRIVLKDTGAEEVYEFPYRRAVTKGGSYKYDVTNSKNDKLTLIISKSKCSDGMSDRQYSYSAAAIINSKILKGCAIRKGDKLSSNH